MAAWLSRTSSRKCPSRGRRIRRRPPCGFGGAAVRVAVCNLLCVRSAHGACRIGNFNGAPGVQSWTDYAVSAAAAFAPPPPTPPPPSVVHTEPCGSGPSSLQSWIIVGGALPAQITTTADASLCLGLGAQDPGWDAPSVAVVPCNSTAAVTWSLNASTKQLQAPGGLCADVLHVRAVLHSS